MSQVVFITGCSTGIGRDLAQRLTRSGYRVAATARKLETLQGLEAALKLPLDVAEPESVRQAVECTLEHFGRIDVLVNNAGYALRGAVEEVPLEQVQAMFDVNVYGAIRMVQAVAPIMRQQGSGRIINISSVAGRLVTPGNGTYSASKFALEALSDALRLELEPFGIQVVLIEPGPIKTAFQATVGTYAEDIFSNPASPYRGLYRQYEQVEAGMRRQEYDPEVVSQVVQQAMEASKPKARYLTGFNFAGRLVMMLGKTAWDLAVRQMYKI